MLRGDLPADIAIVAQADQLKNPDAVVTLDVRADCGSLCEFADGHCECY